MTLERILVIDFNNRDKTIFEVVVPQGAVLKEVKVFHDGIYAFYLYPTVRVEGLSVTDRFTTIKLGENIPQGATLVQILDSIIEMDEGEQGVVIYPIFKLE